MVNWDDDDVQEFKREARALQQDFCDLLGDREWDAIESWNWLILRKKVGYGLFGPPSRRPSDKNLHTGYKKKQLDVIEKICDQLVEDLDFRDRDIHFACIFVVLKIHENRFTVPVFKARRSGSSRRVYVDADARKYSSWGDYLENNTLPKCIYCYPTDGLYEYNSRKKVCVSFGTSPACDFLSRGVGATDTTAKWVGLGSSVVGVLAICSVPIAGPILAGAAIAGTVTGVYGATRSSYALYDRATHGQSIGLDDAEARGHWLSIVGSGLSLAQGRMMASVTKAARAGEVMGKAGRIVFVVVQTGSLTVNGVAIVNNLVALVEKSERDELTPLDVYQFSASLLFFTNSAVNFKDAKTIIKEVQHDVINSHREGLSRDARKLFNKQTGRLRGPDELHGNAKVVKQLNRIENSRDLYELMADKNVASHKVKLTPEGFKGKVVVNKNFKIHPNRLHEMPAPTRQAAFELTRNYAFDEIQDDTDPYCCRRHRDPFERAREEMRGRRPLDFEEWWDMESGNYARENIYYEWEPTCCRYHQMRERLRHSPLF